MFIKKWRFIWTKILWGKLIVFFYLYNNCLEYFLEWRLHLPDAMRKPFGHVLGEALGDEKNQLWLYVVLAAWLAIAL